MSEEYITHFVVSEIKRLGAECFKQTKSVDSSPLIKLNNIGLPEFDGNVARDLINALAEWGKIGKHRTKQQVLDSTTYPSSKNPFWISTGYWQGEFRKILEISRGVYKVPPDTVVVAHEMTTEQGRTLYCFENNRGIFGVYCASPDIRVVVYENNFEPGNFPPAPILFTLTWNRGEGQTFVMEEDVIGNTVRYCSFQNGKTLGITVDEEFSEIVLETNREFVDRFKLFQCLKGYSWVLGETKELKDIENLSVSLLNKMVDTLRSTVLPEIYEAYKNDRFEGRNIKIIKGPEGIKKYMKFTYKNNKYLITGRSYLKNSNNQHGTVHFECNIEILSQNLLPTLDKGQKRIATLKGRITPEGATEIRHEVQYPIKLVGFSGDELSLLLSPKHVEYEIRLARNTDKLKIDTVYSPRQAITTIMANNPQNRFVYDKLKIEPGSDKIKVSFMTGIKECVNFEKEITKALLKDLMLKSIGQYSNDELML